ncbi:hypothetical protein EDB84DRAFT_1446059 [Lactarius hengduanensis]|nr:hypothetical protein EDB84DRAFT_1446059 [Lactarius hengduanensis]
MTKENEEEWAVDANVFISQEDDDTQVYSIRLKTFYDGNPSIVIVDQRPLINFGRCTLLLKRIGEVQRYRAPAAVDLLEKHHPPQHHWRRSSNSSGDSTAAGTGAGAAALAWVKAVLENAPNSISSEKFEACVKELAEKERRMCETRELELRVLGFGPPTPRTGTRGSSDQNDNNDRNTTDEDDDDDEMAAETVAGAGSSS